MIFLTGGARSGKTAVAASLISDGSWPVTLVATGQASDDEMAERIERHRAERPGSWHVVEEPLDLGSVIRKVDPNHGMIIDCLTLWVSNLLERETDAAILSMSEESAELAATRPGKTVVVTNEVGSGLVPMHEVGRRFRDLQGKINQMWSKRSEEAYMVVAGRLLPLKAPDEIGV